MMSIDVDVLMRLARCALKAGDAFSFIRVVGVPAKLQPHNPEWMLGYLSCLTRLGLNDAAQEVLGVLPEFAKTHPDFARVREAVASGRGGRMAWSARRRRFQANLQALATRDPRAAQAIERAWDESAEKFELHQCRDGNFQLKPVGATWPPDWRPFLDDHRALAERSPFLPREGAWPAPIVFEGVGLGWELQTIHEKTADVFLQACSALYVVEPNPEALAPAFHLHDWRDLAASPRVRWFVGPEAPRALERFLKDNPSWPLTDRFCRSSSAPAETKPTVKEIVVGVGRHRQDRIQTLHRTLSQLYQGRDARYWARRFDQAIDEDGRAAERPLRVLALTSRHTTFLQYSMRDCLKALNGLGHETHLLLEPSDHQPLQPLDVLEAQRQFEPDLIFLLSRMRYEMKEMLHPAIPSLTWDQDALPWVFNPSRKPELAWNDFLMGFAAREMAERFGWPAHRCHFCLMAGSPDTYSDETLSEEELAPYRCDVSYVSHASAPVEEEIESVTRWLPEEGSSRRIFREAARRLVSYWRDGGEFPGPIMPTILEVHPEALSPDWPWDRFARLIPALHRIGDRVFRHGALTWVADWADKTGRVFHLWGRGWERHEALRRHARGEAKNGLELRRIYRASTINLQLMAFGFLHQRALDGLMAGDFFLTRRTGADADGKTVGALLKLLDGHGIGAQARFQGARDPEVQARIERLCRQAGGDPRWITPEQIRHWRRAVQSPDPDDILPRFFEIVFDSADEFERRAERFLAAAEERRALAREMRNVLVEQFSYHARLARMLRFIRDGFRRQAERPDPVECVS